MDVDSEIEPESVTVKSDFNIPEIRFSDFMYGFPKADVLHLSPVEDDSNAVINTFKPIHIAAYSGRLQVLNWLILKGADPNSDDSNKRKPIHLAALKGHKDVVKFLLSADTDVNCYDGNFRQPIHYAAVGGHKELMELLVDSYGADVTCHDAYDCRPIHYAALAGHVPVVEWLIGKNIDPNCGNGWRRGPLHYAVLGGHIALIQCLVNHGANLNCEDWRRSKLIHEAALTGHLSIMKWLVEEQGANVESEDLLKMRPLHAACRNGHRDTIKWLVTEAGAVINAKDWNGRIPSNYIQSNDTECVKMLEEAKDGRKTTEYYKIPKNSVTIVCRKYKIHDIPDTINKIVNSDVSLDKPVVFCYRSSLHESFHKDIQTVTVSYQDHVASVQSNYNRINLIFDQESQISKDPIEMLLSKKENIYSNHLPESIPSAFIEFKKFYYLNDILLHCNDENLNKDQEGITKMLKRLLHLRKDLLNFNEMEGTQRFSNPKPIAVKEKTVSISAFIPSLSEQELFKNNICKFLDRNMNVLLVESVIGEKILAVLQEPHEKVIDIAKKMTDSLQTKDELIILNRKGRLKDLIETTNTDGIIYYASIQKLNRSLGEMQYSPKTDDCFSKLSRIGGGGYASVYKAKYQQRNCAVKVPHSIDDSNRETHIAEILVAARVKSHENIIKFYDFLVNEGEYYIVMELMQRSLNDYMVQHDNRAGLPEVKVIQLSQQILNGLAYLHHNSIVHRDLTAKNILLDSENVKVKLTDFGLAKYMENLSNRDSSIISAVYSYMPPESFEDEISKYSFPSDVWSFGVLIYVMSTGKQLFEGCPPHKITYALGNLNCKPLPYKWDLTKVTDRIKKFVESIMKSDPQKRPICEVLLKDDMYKGVSI